MVLLHLGPGLANGLANLHNARRARSQVWVLVGEMATWHVDADPVLCMDIASLAATVSGKVITLLPQPQPLLHGSLPTEAAPRQLDSRQPPSFAVHVERGARAGNSRIATVMVPHDASWGPAGCMPAAEAARAAQTVAGVASMDGTDEGNAAGTAFSSKNSFKSFRKPAQDASGGMPSGPLYS